MFIWLPDRGWDLRVSTEALDYVRRGLDPYIASINHQRIEQALGHHVFIYWYPPVIVDALRILNRVPDLLRHASFWIIYALGFTLQLWAASRLVLRVEWKIVRYLLPLVVFFPGCLPDDTILSGNLAIPMLGLVLFTCVRGWEVKRWTWFYISVIGCSLIKPPILVWLIVPFFLESAERRRSVLAGLAGVASLGAQRLLYPQRFAEFLQTVRYAMPMESNYSSGALLARLISVNTRPPTSLVILASAFSTFGVLLVLVYFSRKHHLGYVTSLSFFTILLLAVALLSPRLKQYDLLPLTLPMCLLILRSLRFPVHRIVLVVAGCIAIGLLVFGWDNIASPLLVLSVFGCGSLRLFQEARIAPKPSLADVEVPELVGASLN